MSELCSDCMSSGRFSPLLPGCIRLGLSHLISLDLCAIKKRGKLKVSEVCLCVTLEAFSYLVRSLLLLCGLKYLTMFYFADLKEKCDFYSWYFPLQKRSWGRSTGEMPLLAKVGKLQRVKGTESWISSIWALHSVILSFMASYNTCYNFDLWCCPLISFQIFLSTKIPLCRD